MMKDAWGGGGGKGARGARGGGQGGGKGAGFFLVLCRGGGLVDLYSVCLIVIPLEIFSP